MNNRNKALLVFLIAFTGVILMMAWILKEPSVLSLVTSAICIPLLLWFAAINLRIIAMHQQKGKVSAVFLPTDRVSIIGRGIDGEIKRYHRPVAIANGSLNIYVVCNRKIKQGDYVSTKYGRAIIEKIGLKDYKGSVWNVYLASKYFIDEVLPHISVKQLYYHMVNSSLGLTPKQHLIFGNGILSGDLYVQIHTNELSQIGYSLKQYV